MSIEMLRGTLLWCSIINYAVLLTWLLLYVLPHGWLYRIWGKWFRLTAEQFDTINFAAIVLYETCILFFNIVPLVALYLAA